MVKVGFWTPFSYPPLISGGGPELTTKSGPHPCLGPSIQEIVVALLTVNLNLGKGRGVDLTTSQKSQSIRNHPSALNTW